MPAVPATANAPAALPFSVATGPAVPSPLRHLVVILGDQLDRDSTALTEFDPARDAIWLAEVAAESTNVWSHQQRIALFLSAMRHFAAELRARGWPVLYRELTADNPGSDLPAELAATLARHRPERVVMIEAGEHRLATALAATCAGAGVPREVRPDTHFLASTADFAAHATGRKSLRMEYFYREMRQRYGVLLAPDGKPTGGEWNFDAENREPFPEGGPGPVPPPTRFAPDAITQGVLALVRQRFGGHPGSLASFAWPVTPAHARLALAEFIAHRLPHFGRFQDALWAGEPWLYHSHLSAALNLKLLHPREAIAAAEAAYRAGRAPLAAVEGFIRQILGWREYVRGIYWHFMPGYLERNALGADQPLPAFYWTGDTPMACLGDALRMSLAHGYAHHIQRLMITGLYPLLLGVRPAEVHQWYLAMYVDAVEWVELPNTLGMSQFGDGGIMASKPYAASGKYIQRMSNYCARCHFDPAQSTGPRACPFTTLYWDFLLRHEERFARHPRMAAMIRNAQRLSDTQRAAIAAAADRLRAQPAGVAPTSGQGRLSL